MSRRSWLLTALLSRRRTSTDRFDDPSSEPAAVPVSVLKQEEEDIQRAIAESEALARNQQQGRSSYAPPASTSYGQPASSAYGGYQQPQAGTSGTSFFTQADGKALPEIQAEPHQAAASAPPAPSASPAQGPSRVKALYDFEPQEEGELAFRKGDVIRVINSAYEGWWKGELDGRVGIFPLTYIVSTGGMPRTFAAAEADKILCRKSYPIQRRKA